MAEISNYLREDGLRWCTHVMIENAESRFCQEGQKNKHHGGNNCSSISGEKRRERSNKYMMKEKINWEAGGRKHDEKQVEI